MRRIHIRSKWQISKISNIISSTERYVNIDLVKAWSAIDSLSSIRKSDLSEKLKPDFFQAVSVTIVLY